MATQILPSGIEEKQDRLTQQERSFVESKQYCKSVTPKTLQYYEQSFHSFAGCVTRADYTARIVAMQKRGVKPRSINSWIIGINTYLHWSNAPRPDDKCYKGCDHLKLSKLKVEDKILETFTLEQMQAIVGWKPTCANDRRVQAVACFLLDTGVRIDEALNIQRSHVDLEQMQVLVTGKGRKQRIVPLSNDGRRRLYQWMRGQEQQPASYVFSTGTGTHLSIRNCQRDLHTLCTKAKVTGVRCSPHTFRHTFAVSYLRAGGNIEYLRRILGHTTLQITQNYLRSLTPSDITNVHNSFSPLAKL